MNILLFGENCTGKSTIGKRLEKDRGMKLYSGKDYLRLAKNPSEALTKFKALLENDTQGIVFVSAELDQVDMIPVNVKKVLFTESLDIKKERFSQRFRGNLPKAVEEMIERKHGMFDEHKCDLSFSGDKSIEETISEVGKLFV